MITYLETHIVDHCNLHCRGCSHFSGLAPERFKSIQDFIAEMEQLSSITDLHTFRLMGGEPLLHPNFIDFFVVARHFFPNTDIVLVTNGILLPSLTDEQIDILNELKISLCVSDYGLKIDRAQMEKFNVNYFHGKSRLYNVSLDLSGSQNPTYSYNHCDLVHGGWFFLKDGRIYQCCVMANIEFFCNHFDKKLDIDLDDISIDIFNHTEEEIKIFLTHPHITCRYCDTLLRSISYQDFAISKGDINEWTV